MFRTPRCRREAHGIDRERQSFLLQRGDDLQRAVAAGVVEQHKAVDQRGVVAHERLDDIVFVADPGDDNEFHIRTAPAPRGRQGRAPAACAASRTPAGAPQPAQEGGHCRYQPGGRQRIQPGLEAAGGIPRVADHHRAEEAADIAERVDQRDAGRQGGSGQERGRQRPEGRPHAVVADGDDREGQQHPQAVVQNRREHARDGQAAGDDQHRVAVPHPVRNIAEHHHCDRAGNE